MNGRLTIDAGGRCSFCVPLVILRYSLSDTEEARYIHEGFTEVLRRAKRQSRASRWCDGGLTLVSRRCNGDLTEMSRRYHGDLTEVYASNTLGYRSKGVAME